MLCDVGVETAIITLLETVTIFGTKTRSEFIRILRILRPVGWSSSTYTNTLVNDKVYIRGFPAPGIQSLSLQW